jgi:hypothetical protein
MIKILLIVVLIIYALNKLGLFRIFVQSNRGYDGRQSQQRPNDGNVNIDNNPNNHNRKKSDFKGGEYVDYEEVK